MIQIFSIETLAAIVIGVIVFLAFYDSYNYNYNINNYKYKKPIEPKELTGEEWYQSYKASCIVPQWMNDLNKYKLSKGDKVVCLEYGRYGLIGKIKSILEIPHVISGQEPKQHLEVDWELAPNAKRFVDRENVVRINEFKKKKK